MKHKETLQQLGLDEKEASVYLALFELGEGSVQEIARQAKVSRPATYAVLDGLAAKGLCSLSDSSGKARYLLESPGNLLDLVKMRKRELESQEKAAEALVAELEESAKRHTTEDGEPFIRYFSGKRGMLAMRNDMFEVEDSTLRMAYSLDNYERAYDDLDRKEAHALRTKKNIFAKVFYNADTAVISDDATREAVKVPQELPLSADIAIYNGKVRLSLFDGTSGVIITNKKIAETLASLFDLAWSANKRTE